MKRFVESEDRRQGVLLPEYLEDYVSENNQVRVIDVFVDELDLGGRTVEPEPEEHFWDEGSAVSDESPRSTCRGGFLGR